MRLKDYDYLYDSWIIFSNSWNPTYIFLVSALGQNYLKVNIEAVFTIYLLQIFIRFVSKLHNMSLLHWVCQIGMQGPQLYAKPRHFCKSDVATSIMAIVELNLHGLQVDTSNSNN